MRALCLPAAAPALDSSIPWSFRTHFPWDESAAVKLTVSRSLAFHPSWSLHVKKTVGNCSRGGSSAGILHRPTARAARGSVQFVGSAVVGEGRGASFQAREITKGDAWKEEILVLDMEAYFSGGDDRVVEFCEQLREQCHTVGFLNVKNQGVPHELCDSVLQLGCQFFDLPSELKHMQLDYRNSAQFRGYMQIGVGNTAGLTDFREQVELGPEEAEDVDIHDGVGNRLVYPVYRRLHGPNQWPPEHVLPKFKPKVEEFMNRMGTLSMHIMQALALSLGLRKNYFDSSFQKSPHYQMKIARYPPKSEDEDADKLGMFGVGEHSDSGFLSLLLQDDVGGLQAQTVAGEWNNVTPKRGIFVVNLGEMLQLATGGYYLATAHRGLSHRY